MEKQSSPLEALLTVNFNESAHSQAKSLARGANLSEIKRLLELGNEQLNVLRQRISTYPVKAGVITWMSIEEMDQLGLGLNKEQLSKEIKEKLGYFPQYIDKKGPTSVTKYGLIPTTIQMLDRSGVTIPWVSDAAQYDIIGSNLRPFRGDSAILERRLANSMSGSDIDNTVTNRTENNRAAHTGNKEGFWMTYAQIAMHSEKRKDYLPVIVGGNKNKFRKLGEGRGVKIGITADNYHRLGIKEFPPKGNYERMESSSGNGEASLR